MSVTAEKGPRRSTIEHKQNGTAPSSKDNSLTKVDEEWQMVGEEPLKNLPNKASVKKNDSHFTFRGVRFTPKVIEFLDAFEGKQFTVNFTMQNVSRNPVLIKIGEPNSFIFQLKKPVSRSKLLAPGASITRSISYSYHNDDLVQRSQLPVQINGRLIDYPIVVKRAVGEIEVSPNKLDFKIINLGASAKTLVLSILNTGGRRTRFEIDVGTNDLDLVVTPIRGMLRPKTQVNVRVEMMGLTEGEYYKELWITTSDLPIRVPVLVEVVRPRLEITHPKGTEDFTLIDFRPTFTGAQRVDSVVLRNCSAEATLFLTLAETNGDLQFLSEARETHHTFNMFSLTAEEGRLEPFESRILTVMNYKTNLDLLRLPPIKVKVVFRFKPKEVRKSKGWHSKQAEKRKMIEWEHIVFFRINRVHCVERKQIGSIEGKTDMKSLTVHGSESVMQAASSATVTQTSTIRKVQHQSAPPSEEEDTDSVGRIRKVDSTETSITPEKIIRLCLHGKAVEPKVVVQPSSMNFQKVKVGESKDKVLRITNNSIIPAKYRYRKTMNVALTPKEGWLQPDQAMELLVRLTPTAAGMFNTKIVIEILGTSDVVYETDQSMVMVAEVNVPVQYSASFSSVAPVPKISHGIDNAGTLNELLTYGSTYKKPYAAMLLSLNEATKPEWMKNEVDKVNMVDNAIIALPNDRPRFFYSWPKEKICRAIFSGMFRYSPPEDPTYSFTPEEKRQKMEQKSIWIDYLHFLKELRKLNYPNEEEIRRCEREYDISCKKHYNMETYKPETKFISTVERLGGLRSYFERKLGRQPRRALVPLSPMYLWKIKVEPKFIDFNTVASNTLVHESLTVRNQNPFSVSIRFVPGKSAVTMPNTSTITVPPQEAKSLLISFQRKELGRYYGFLNYVINGSHEFKITISAFVTSKSLILHDKDSVVEFGNYPESKAFQPRSSFMMLENLLQCSIAYRWEFPPESAFTTEIIEGEIPPRTKLFTEMTFELDPSKSFFLECGLVSESGTTDLVKLMRHANKDIPVTFLKNHIDLHDIPLNMSTKVTPIVQNACYYDVVFEVVNWTPMPGVVVEPKQGVLRARSFTPLEIHIQIPVVMTFSFEVTLCVHEHTKISVTVNGNVVLPLIRVRPVELTMRRICAQSFDRIAICVENAGTTPADIALDFKGCPEYRVLDGKGKAYLLPTKTAKFLIHFQPTDVARYVFYLPIVINNILGPPMMQEPETEYLYFYISRLEYAYKEHGEVMDSRAAGVKIPCVTINCTVTPNVLRVSTFNVNFQLQPNQLTKFQPQLIVFSNDLPDDVTFCIRDDDLGVANESFFDLVPLKQDAVEFRSKSIKATLKEGEQLVLEATFEPKKPGVYTAEVPIFVRGYNNGIVFNYINLKGEMKKSRMYADCKEIHFPPLPLHIGCEASVTIFAENYEIHDEITCLIWDSHDEGEPLTNRLKTTWLNEPNIVPCLGIQKFTLILNFCSHVPVALRNYLVFIDSNGGYCTVLVTASSDNSTLTTHAFLATRTNKYRLIRSSPPPLPGTAQGEALFAASKPEVKIHTKVNKKGKYKSSANIREDPVSSAEAPTQNNTCSLPIDKGPRLVVQVTKSMNRPTQLNFVNVRKNSMHPKEKFSSSSTASLLLRAKYTGSFLSRSDSYSGSRTLLIYPPGSPFNREVNEVTHPNFPGGETLYGKHFKSTLAYVERWIFEVVMRCDQYFVIPKSFQQMREVEIPPPNSKKTPKWIEKDFLDFLEEIIGSNLKNVLPKRICCRRKSLEKAVHMRRFFSDILRFLSDQGCLLPHVQPEYLMNFEDYVTFCKSHDLMETFKWKTVEPIKINSVKLLKEVSMNKAGEEDDNTVSSTVFVRESWKKSLFEGYRQSSDEDLNEEEEKMAEEVDGMIARPLDGVRHLVEDKQFTHEREVLGRTSFQGRSTQAWLDIVIQVFRVFVLTKVNYKNTIPEVAVLKMEDRLYVEDTERSTTKSTKVLHGLSPAHTTQSLDNNLYTFQERILLTWLNYHFHAQKELLWPGRPDALPNTKIVNNFDKDLSDSIVLIAVTAAHCPYLNSELGDVFLKPNTPNKMHHNACKLIKIWRMLNVGLTVETGDIIKPNQIFMVMLVTHLYDVLPSLHPRSLVCFSAPLAGEITRTIQLKNVTAGQIFYEARFMGEHEGLFRLDEPSSLIEVKPSKTVDLKIVFTARKIKKVTATLILNGAVISPSFGRDLVFYLEGEPSQLLETKKFIFEAPLYKPMCVEVPVVPPYKEPTTYDIWYTTSKPVYDKYIDISHSVKPWSKIWNRKVSRRLFLNQNEVVIGESRQEMLNVTIACLSEDERFFWLLFRSAAIGDFIILLEIKSKPTLTHVAGSYADNWSSTAECLCPSAVKANLFNFNAMCCPLLTKVRIPARNDLLWDSMRIMFLKTLSPEEKSFWSQHFEMNIGICLILWLLSADEEEAVLDEFVDVLQTQVSYILKVEPPNEKTVTVPDRIDISDVREATEISLPLHISKGAPKKMRITLTMVSENRKELRRFRITLTQRGSKLKNVVVRRETPEVPRPICEGAGDEGRQPCDEKWKCKKKKSSK